jgi:2,4-dienoyl-CoA reductase-like NADH-dependent reductase (Old Yellow Enzyme family)
MRVSFGDFAERLDTHGLAYLHVIEPRMMGTETLVVSRIWAAASYLRKFFKGPIIAAGSFDRDVAGRILQHGDANLVTFGRWFSSNLDLLERCRRDRPLAPYVRVHSGAQTQARISASRSLPRMRRCFAPSPKESFHVEQRQHSSQNRQDSRPRSSHHY